MKRWIILGCLFLAINSGLYLSLSHDKNHYRAKQQPFKVAFWNVNNLFDMERQGGEYESYIPFTHSWIPSMYQKKLYNIGRVIRDLNASIIGLAEVESSQALDELNRLTHYPYSAIASTPYHVKPALLSRFPIVLTQTLPVQGEVRGILYVKVMINDKPLHIIVNHWKSKQGKESQRMAYAYVVKNFLTTLPQNEDSIVIGDFNSNYNEHETFVMTPLNDTQGKTGLTTLLQTYRNNEMVRKDNVQKGELVNLWQELPKSERWSEIFGIQKGSIDAILLTAALFDSEGIAYYDKSFQRFIPNYLMQNGVPYRWQITKNGKGEHTGEGYSDHLPIYALFYEGEYKKESNPYVEAYSYDQGDLSLLKEKGKVGKRYSHLHVIFKEQNRAILHDGKQGIWVYGCTQELKEGGMYSLQIDALRVYQGMLEVSALSKVNYEGQKEIVPQHVHSLNELKVGTVVSQLHGEFQRGYLVVGDQKVKLRFDDATLKIPHKARIMIHKGVVQFAYRPEIYVKKEDIQGEFEAIPELYERK